MSAKIEKSKQKVLQEKNQAILCELLKLDDNKYCADCDAKGDPLSGAFSYAEFNKILPLTLNDRMNSS